MNKRVFVEQVSKELNIDLAKSREIVDCLDDNFLIGKSNKEKTIELFQERLNITKEEAENYYNVTHKLIAKNLKNKLIHPFKSKD